MDSDPLARQRRFLARLRPDLGLAILDQLPDVYVFVKDREGRFVLCNRAFLRLIGCEREEQLIGLGDADFSPRYLCEQYAADDALVAESGEPLIDKLELVRNPDGTITWNSTTKLPVRGRDGSVIGVAGLIRDLKKSNTTTGHFLAMAPVVETIMRDYARPLTVADLAARLGLSVSQFERLFKRKFRTTPIRYLIQVRIDVACELLTTGDLPIAQIALDTGFYDQSHFTHLFQRHKGVTPSRYRDAYRGGKAAEA